MSDTIDMQTSFTEALRKRALSGRTYIGEKGRDTPEETALKWCGVASKAQFQAALKAARDPFGTSDGLSADEATAGRNVSLQLEREFPGWQWVVKVEEGVLSFYEKNLSLKWGVHWSLIKGHPHESWVRKQAGEMLERFNAPRRGVDVSDFVHNAQYRMMRGGLHMAFEE